MKRLALACLLMLPTLAAALPPAPADSLLWESEQAAIDSLNSYWRTLDADWYDPLTPELLDFGLDAARLDSLTAVGDVLIGRILSGRYVKTDFHPFGMMAFNRTEGLRPGASLEFVRPGPAPARLEIGAGYGIASERVVHEHGLDLPLAVARPRDDRGALKRRPWPWLSLRAEGGRATRAFGGELGRTWDMWAFLYGEEPSQFYEDEFWRAGLRLRPRPELALELGGGHHDERPRPVATRWTLFGEASDVDPNLQVPALTARELYAGLRWRRGRVEAGARMTWLRAAGDQVNAPWGATDALWHRRLRLDGAATLIDRWGTEYALKGVWRTADRRAPPQWQLFLGDYGTLRGFEARELAGDEGGLATLDVRLGADPFRALRVPLLKSFRLQPILFAEYGRALRAEGPGEPYGATGWRADVGFGFGKAIGLPGVGGNLRMYVARPVGPGMGDYSWRVTVGVE